MGFASFVPSTTHQPQHTPLDFLRHPYPSGLHAANNLATVWGVDVTIRDEYRDAHRKAAEWKKFVAQHRNPESFATRIADAEPDKWEGLVREAHASVMLPEAISRQDHEVGPLLERTATAAFNSWETYADLHRQLPVEAVTAEFVAAAQSLGDNAWNLETARTLHMDDHYRLAKSGEKLQTLLAVRDGITAPNMSRPIPNTLALVAKFEDLPQLEWATPKEGSIATIGAYKAKHTKDDEHRHDVLHRANSYRDHPGALMVRIAIGEFDGISLDLTADRDEYKRRVNQIQSIDQRAGAPNAGAGTGFRPPIEQVENPS